jgi:hypothetical protein
VELTERNHIKCNLVVFEGDMAMYETMMCFDDYQEKHSSRPKHE